MERLSTGLRNYILQEGSFREAFKDCKIQAYSGTAPASADDAYTGVLLLTLTKASGALLSTAYGVPSRWSITIPGTHASGTYKVSVTYGTTAYVCTYDTEATGAEGHGSNDDIARGLARKIVDECPHVFAIAEGANSKLYVQSKIPGINLAIVDGGGTVTIVTFAEILAETAVNSLQFGIAASGAMAKTSDVWSGVVAVSGVVGYFRIVRPNDDGTLSTTQVRAQGNAATSGAELGFSNTSLVAGETHTADNYSISLPAE